MSNGRKFKTFYLFIITFFSCQVFTQVDNFDLIIYDSVFMFDGDIKIEMDRFVGHNKTIYIRMSNGQSIVKKYCDTSGILLRVDMRDNDGYMHGNFYAYDPLKTYKTYGNFIHDKLIYSVTLNQYSDTIAYTKFINDTLSKNMKIQGDTIIKTERNEWFNKNGDYQVLDVETKQVLVKGNYQAFNSFNVLDKKMLSSRAKTYGIQIFFAGSTDENMEISVPVGKWFFYSKDGKLINTIEYDWTGVFR